MNWELVVQFVITGLLGALIGWGLCWKTEVKPRVKMLIHYKKRIVQFHEFVDFHRLHLLWLRFTA